MAIGVLKNVFFPPKFPKAPFKGRHGSSACTLTALVMGFKFSSGLIGEPKEVLHKGWFGHVVSSISEGNKIFDECFSAAEFGELDVEDTFSSVGDDLHLFFYKDPTFFINGNNFQGVISNVRERASMKGKSVGIFVSGGRTVVILVWENNWK